MQFNVSEWIEDEMEKREWSIHDLARESGLTYQAISQWIKEIRMPTLQSFMMLLDAFGLHFEIKEN